jgi:hypothetical protein
VRPASGAAGRRVAAAGQLRTAAAPTDATASSAGDVPDVIARATLDGLRRGHELLSRTSS